MRSKHIVALITFFTCFALSSFFAGLIADKTAVVNDLYKFVKVQSESDNDASKKILALLLQDKENELERNVAVYSFQDEDESFSLLAVEARITSEYVKDSSSIDDSGLPRDFQIAWRKHMKAWADYSDFFRKAERAGMSFQDIERLEFQYRRDVNTTWAEVLHIAATYGAKFSE